eukprot:172966-Amphidinium_carterae.1
MATSSGKLEACYQWILAPPVHFGLKHNLNLLVTQDLSQCSPATKLLWFLTRIQSWAHRNSSYVVAIEVSEYSGFPFLALSFSKERDPLPPHPHLVVHKSCKLCQQMQVTTWGCVLSYRGHGRISEWEVRLETPKVNFNQGPVTHLNETERNQAKSNSSHEVLCPIVCT